MISPLTLTPYSMATIDRCKTNKAQGMKYLTTGADHAQLPGPNENALVQQGNSSFPMNDASPTKKMISHRFFGILPVAEENKSIQTAMTIVSINSNNTNDFLCANILEDQAQWRYRNQEIKQSRNRRECANRQRMDEGDRNLRRGNIKAIGF